MIRTIPTFLCLMLAALSAQAAEVIWTSTTGGNFNDGANWSTAPNPPATGDIAIIQNGDTATINADFTNNPLANLYVGNAGGNGTINQSAGTLTVSGGAAIGRSNTTPGAVGVYNLSGGRLTVGSTTASYFLVGDGLTTGTGTLNISGTGAAAGWLDLPAGETFIGGMVVPSTTGTGVGGNGTLNMTGDSKITQTTTATSFGYFYIARDGATGIMTMTDNASFQKTNGNFPIVVGGGYGGAGGAGGNGTLTMSGNSTITNASGEIWIGQGTGSTGTLTLNDNATINLGSYFCVGRDGGAGTFTMNGNCTVNETGNGFCVVGSVGGATGTVIQNGGTYKNVNALTLAEGTSTAEWHLNGGLMQATLIQSGSSTIGGGTGAYYFNGGTLQAMASQSNYTPTFGTATLSMWVQTGGAFIDTNGKNITITQALWEDPLSPGGGLTKIGSGILNLTNTNTYTGNIAVNGGTLLLNYPSVQGGLTTTVASGATLGGNCILQDVVVSSGGGLSPGKNPQGAAPYPNIGTMRLNNLNITNSTLNYYLNRPTNSDLIDVSTGTVTATVSGGQKNNFFFDTEVPSEMTAGDYPLIKCGALNLIGGATFNDVFGLPNIYVGDFDAAIGVKDDLSIGPTGKLIYVTLTPSANGWKGPNGGLYSVAANWKTVVPNASGAKALFAGDGTPPSVILDITPTIGKLVFNNAASYTISTNNNSRFFLNAGPGVPAEVDDLAGSHTIAVNMTMQKDTNFVVIGATDTLTMSGILAGSVGSPKVTKDGPGTLILSGNNTYVGSTAVLGGTLQLNGTNAYTGATTVTNGTLIAKVIANAGVASSIGAAGASPSNLVLDNATFQYSGAAAASSTRGITLADNVTIDSAQNLTLSGGLAMLNALNVTLTTPGAGVITISGPITDLAAAPRFFKAGSGTLILASPAGTSNTLGQGLYDGCFIVRDGTLTLAGADNTTQYYVRNGEVVIGGTEGMQPATFNLQSGTLNIQTWLSIGRGNTNTTAMNMTGGVLNTANMSIGYDAGQSGYTGTQVFNLSGNAVVNSTATGTGATNYIGESGGTNATLNISDTAQLNTSTYLIVGLLANATGTVNQSGGAVTSATDLRIGQAGNGTYNQTGGTVTGQYLRIGLAASAVGMYNLTGGSANLSTGIEADLGAAGTGSLNVGGTGTITLPPLYLGRSFWGGTAEDGGTGNLRVYGTGSVTVNGYVTGSSLGLPSETLIGKANIDLDGGTLTANGIAKADGGVGGGGVMTVNFNGGVLKAGASDDPANPTTPTWFLRGINAANIKAGGAIINTNGFNVTVDQILAADAVSTGGGLTKQGSGTLTIAKNASYTGNTTVSQGILDAININTPSAAVSVAAGGNELIASSIVANSLTVGAGATVVIKPLPGGPLGADSGPLAAVPEPSTLVLLVIAVLMNLAAARRRSN